MHEGFMRFITAEQQKKVGRPKKAPSDEPSSYAGNLKEFEMPVELRRQKETHLLTENKRKGYEKSLANYRETLTDSSDPVINEVIGRVAERVVSGLNLEYGVKFKSTLIRSHEINAFVFKDKGIDNFPTMESAVKEIPIFINTGFVYYLSEHYRKKREIFLGDLFKEKNLNLPASKFSACDSFAEFTESAAKINLPPEVLDEIKALYENDRFFLSEDKIASVFCHEAVRLTEGLSINRRNSQEMEYRADVAGQKLLDAAGYNSEAAEETMIFLEYLSKEGTFSVTGSHPSPNLRRKEMQLAYSDIKNVARNAGKKQERMKTLSPEFKGQEVRRSDRVRDDILSCKETAEIVETINSLENIDEYAVALKTANELINYNLARQKVLTDPKFLQNALIMTRQAEISRENFLRSCLTA